MTGKPAQTSDEKSAELIYAFFNEIGIIGQLSGTAMRRALPKGMTMAQFSVLNHFARLGGEHTPAQLAASFQVTKGAMTNTLQKLEAKDHIHIVVNVADKRRKRVTITKAGLHVRNQAIAALTTPVLQLAEKLDVADIKTMLPMLQKIREELDKARTAEDFANVD